MAAPTSGQISLKAHIRAEYAVTSPTVPSGLPASYRGAATSTNQISMSQIATGAPMWDSSGNKTSDYSYFGYGAFPYYVPYGTYKLIGSATDYTLRNSRTLIPQLTGITGSGVGTAPRNMKLSDYYGTFYPFYSNLVLNSAGTTTYTLGAGTFWIKALLAGGGGGGGGGDRDNKNGGAGGAGAQVEGTFYISSASASQAIRIYVGAGGGAGQGMSYGGWANGGGGAGGSGYAAGGAGGVNTRQGQSGRGGGGGGSTAIEWFPNGTGSTGYLLFAAGGGGGGGGAGRYYTSQPADSFSNTASISGGGSYSIYAGTSTYPSYTGTGNGSGNTGYSGHRGPSVTLADATTAGYKGIGGADFYTYYWKPFIRNTYGGVFNYPFIGNGGIPGGYASYSDSTLDSTLGSLIDSGGAGGGGGGTGAPGFLPPMYVYIADDGLGNQSYQLAFVASEMIGGGGMEGFSFYRDNIVGLGNFEYAWRNRTSGYTESRTPRNASNFMPVYTAGTGGVGGTGASTSGGAGTAGTAGAAALSITNANNEYSLYNFTSI